MERPDQLFLRRVRDVRLPTRGHATDAGLDFYVPTDWVKTTLSHGQSILVPSGVVVDVPEGWALIFFNKSGVASRLRLDTLACVVDHGYTGEVHLNVVNNGEAEVSLAPGAKLLQALLLPVATPRIVETESAGLAVSARRNSGFGSTGSC